MPELSGLLCILLVALAVVTLVGHAVWVVLAQIGKSFFGPAPAEPVPSSAADDELRDLAATHRQLRRLVESGALDHATIQQLESRLIQRRRELVRGEPRTAKPHEPAKRSTPVPVVPAEAILDALPADTPAPVAPLPRLPAVEPVILPQTPRRTLGEVLAGFMEEHNILWGELTGGLLIVGCSVALVVYLWQTQREIRYLPFFVVTGGT